MKNFLAMTLTTLFTTSAFAGATNAFFDCTSASGRTTLSASVPGDFAEHMVTLTIDGQKVEYFNTIAQEPPYNDIKNSEVKVTGQMLKKNYGFTISEPGDKSAVLLTFKAVPESIKVEGSRRREQGTLKAIIQGLDPREGGQTVTKPIEVKCTYEYSI